MQSEYYTISPKGGEYEDSALTSVLRIFAIVFFVGGLIGGYILGKQFSDIQNLFATSYRERVDFSWGLAIAVWLSAALSGMLILALREALLILHLQQAQGYTLVIPSDAEQSSAPSNVQYINCPSCGKRQRADRTICVSCGAWLAQT